MMNAKMVRKAMGLCLVLFVALSGVAMAQAGGGRPEGGGRGGRGGLNREEMMARYDKMLRERLEANEEEWEVLGPMVRDGTTKQREARGGGMRRMRGGRRGGRGGREGGAEGEQPGAEVKELSPEEALAKALENKGAPAAEIKAKLAAYRKDVAVKKAELKAAQDELRKVVTQRQEAQLVLMGALD
ncbi:MAG: hypothetical protein HN904_18480 [Victivallales bacterium]|nr:hypothetical protein [Victivallales bacterium]